MASKFTVYRTICEHLETLDQITVATDCFQHMKSELAKETNLHTEQAKWVHGETCIRVGVVVDVNTIVL